MSSAAPEKELPQNAPGQDLRVAREAAGISLTDLADRTLISPHRLEALERDDYEAVGGAAYVKGYARACARQLQLNPNQVVQAFEEKLALLRPQVAGDDHAGSRRPASPVEFGDEGGGTSPLRTLFSGLLALIVLGLFLAVLFGDTDRLEGDSTTMADPQTVSPPDAAVDEPPASASADLVQSPTGRDEMDDGPVTQAIEGSGTEAGFNPGQADTQETRPSSWSTSQDEGSQDGLPLMERDESGTTAPNTTPNGSASTADSRALPGTTPAEAGPMRVLELSFEDRCWVEVTDANGERIIAREAQSGDNLRLSGPAPFNVVLGNAAAAAVRLDGEPVAIKPRSGTNVVRLSLGGR